MSPTFGRFITQDPLDFIGSGLNLYSYVASEPTGFRDPYGLQKSCAVTCAAGIQLLSCDTFNFGNGVGATQPNTAADGGAEWSSGYPPGYAFAGGCDPYSVPPVTYMDPSPVFDVVSRVLSDAMSCVEATLTYFAATPEGLLAPPVAIGFGV